MAGGRVRVEDGKKWIRVSFGGLVVADSRRVRMVWEVPYYPRYYFPLSDVRTELLVPTGEIRRSPSRGLADIHDVVVAGRRAPGAAFVWRDVRLDEIADHVSFDWEAMDHWFEEDEEVFVHARDPYTRIDVLQSSRHVEVYVAGTKVADTARPRLLFETGLPVRAYMPKTDVRLDLLVPSDTRTRCPYKGTARYWHVVVDGTVHEDVAWAYETPLPEVAGIAGFLAFWDEKVDVVVDGVPQERPERPFS